MYPDYKTERRNPPKDGSTPNCPNIYSLKELVGKNMTQRFYCGLTECLCVGNPEDKEFEGLLSYTKINGCSNNPNQK